jgi:uncharacterized repeat protein (TIGR04138 family)
MSTYQVRLGQIVDRDGRYPYEAYDFVFAALNHTQRMLKKVPRDEETGSTEPQCHVSGRELLDGIRDLALREFGLMARVVFRMWGINSTSDFGEIVFNLVSENLMSKSEEDTRDDFRDVYDLEKALIDDFRMELGEAEWMR